MDTAFSHELSNVRAQFPLLSQPVGDLGHPLIYFDNAATTQKPQCVLDAITHYYMHTNANVHRAAHILANQATEQFEDARKKVAHFVGAKSPQEIVFTKGTTDAINLVAHSFGQRLHAQSGIAISYLEHHSNIVPWQLMSQHHNIPLHIIPITDAGVIDLEGLAQLLDTHRIGLIGIPHISNTLGTIQPVEAIGQLAHADGAVLLVDGAQAAAHIPINVQQLGADFYGLSSHKMYGPMGIGALYGREELLKTMPPYQSGGEMIAQVDFEHTSYNTPPHRFEAGTPNVAGVMGWAAAIDWINKVGWETIQTHEAHLQARLHQCLSALPMVQIFGGAQPSICTASFVVQGIHDFDLGQWLSAKGVAVRTGHHCTQPLMKRMGVSSMVRASLSSYNTLDEICNFIEILKRIVSMFKIK